MVLWRLLPILSTAGDGNVPCSTDPLSYGNTRSLSAHRVDFAVVVQFGSPLHFRDKAGGTELPGEKGSPVVYVVSISVPRNPSR